MDFMSEYVVLVILGVCYCVGYILKHIVESEKLETMLLRYLPEEKVNSNG